MTIQYIILVLMFSTAFFGSHYLVSNNVFGAAQTFSASGQISSLVFGMPPSTNIVNMSSVEKFILSGDWMLDTKKGKIANFTSEFYTGPINGANNHTHLLTNMRVHDDKPVQLTTDGSAQIAGLLDVKFNGKSAWSDVPTTISISKGRTISFNVADNGTERHFMGQPIYGVVKELTMGNTTSGDILVNSNMTNKSSGLNTTIPEQLPAQSINGSNIPKI